MDIVGFSDFDGRRVYAPLTDHLAQCPEAWGWVEVIGGPVLKGDLLHILQAIKKPLSGRFRLLFEALGARSSWL